MHRGIPRPASRSGERAPITRWRLATFRRGAVIPRSGREAVTRNGDRDGRDTPERGDQGDTRRRRCGSAFPDRDAVPSHRRRHRLHGGCVGELAEFPDRDGIAAASLGIDRRCGTRLCSGREFIKRRVSAAGGGHRLCRNGGPHRSHRPSLASIRQARDGKREA